MIIKHPFKVNQVWVSETNPEQDFYIYELNEYDGEDAYSSGEDTYALIAKVNAPAFEKQMNEYFKGRKHETTFPFCWFGEPSVKSLKQKVNKYKMILKNTEDYPVTIYPDYGAGALYTTDFENETIWKELQDKYSQ